METLFVGVQSGECVSLIMQTAPAVNRGCFRRAVGSSDRSYITSIIATNGINIKRFGGSYV